MARRDKVRKWSNLKGQLPAAIDLSPRSMEVIAEADKRRLKDDGTPIVMEDLAEEWNGLEEEEEFEDLAKTQRNIFYDALTKRILEELERVRQLAGTDLWRGDDQTFSPKFMLNCRVTDPIALRRWVEETGQQHLLTVPAGRLKGIVADALNTDTAAAMTPAERAALKPGMAGSGVAPPGVEVSLYETVHHTSARRKKTRGAPDPDDSGPF